MQRVAHPHDAAADPPPCRGRRRRSQSPRRSVSRPRRREALSGCNCTRGCRRGRRLDVTVTCPLHARLVSITRPIHGRSVAAPCPFHEYYINVTSRCCTRCCRRGWAHLPSCSRRRRASWVTWSARAWVRRARRRARTELRRMGWPTGAAARRGCRLPPMASGARERRARALASGACGWRCDGAPTRAPATNTPALGHSSSGWKLSQLPPLEDCCNGHVTVM